MRLRINWKRRGACRVDRTGRRHPGKEGFSIVELVIAIAILATALMGIVSLYIQTVALSELNREMQIASFAAQQKLEEIRGISFELLPVSYPAFTPVRFDIPGLEPLPPDTRTGTVIVDYTNPDLLTVTAQVRWRGIRGDSTIPPMTTMISR